MRTGLRFLRAACDYLTPVCIVVIAFANVVLLVTACQIWGVVLVVVEENKEAAEMKAQTEKFEWMARERN